MLDTTAAPSAASPPRLLSIQQAAEQTGMSTQFWRAELRAGRLRHFKIGRVIRIAEVDLSEYLKTCRAGGVQ